LSSLREVLCENTAVFADPDNAQDWVEKIKQLRNDPLKRKLVGDRAKILALDHDIRKRAKEILTEMGAYNHGDSLKIKKTDNIQK